jgi:hypothetical protein
MNWRQLLFYYTASVLESIGRSDLGLLLRNVEVPVIDGGGFRLMTRRRNVHVIATPLFQSLPVVIDRYHVAEGATDAEILIPVGWARLGPPDPSPNAEKVSLDTRR